MADHSWPARLASRQTLSFVATDSDGTPRVFAGMWRPPFEEFLKDKPCVLWYHIPAVRERWLLGEGDRPLYAERSDVVASTASVGRPVGDTTE